jgi:D-aspartate ligase
MVSNTLIACEEARSGSRLNSVAVRRRAVVLCAGLNGLGAIRSLGFAGVPTVAVTLSDDESVLQSRFGEKLVVDQSKDGERALLEALLTIGKYGDVLLPTSDSFVTFIGRNRALLESSFDCCIPAGELIQILVDKAEETRRIESIGVAIPKTVRSLPSLPHNLMASLDFPMILKPRTSEIARELRIKTAPVWNESGLLDWYCQYENHLSDFIAQELIPGGEGTQWECLGVFDRKHRLTSCFTFRKIRTAPSGFGVTCFARSEWNPEIAAIVQGIGAEIGYCGPADFDFKYDCRDATYKYLEMNPRLGMCNYFGTRCGVNCAHDSFLAASGQKTEKPIRRQQNGILFLDVFDDLYGRAGGQRKSLQSICSAICEYTRLSIENVHYAYFDQADLGPWLWTTSRNLQRVASSVRRKLKRRVRPDVLGFATLGRRL